jgi:glycosyltransferase involved in cell wall biosynthesis
MTKILISIIVPCYNQVQYLPEALQSVLNQTYSDWECIIVNDGSPDDTDIVAKEWLIKDPRFKYIYKENGGLSSARNAGIEIAIGTYILPLDADDKIGKDYLKLAAKAFDHKAGLKLVYCKAEKFGAESGSWILPVYSLNSLVRYNSIFCSAVFRKSEWERVGGYDDKMIYGLEDWEFWISILKDGGDVKCLDFVGFYYRITSGSMARSINDEERLFTENYVAKKHIDFVLKRYDEIDRVHSDILVLLNNKKFVLNLFTKMFFGIALFQFKK